MIKHYLLALSALAVSQAAMAIELFETNPTTPYPPGCVSTTRDNLTTPTGGRQVYANDGVTFANASNPSESATVNVMIFRRGCIEPNRSVLYVEFEMVTVNRTFALPEVTLETEATSYPMRLVREPNTFESDETGRILGPGTYEYIVDGFAESAIRQNSNLISPTQYSGPLTFKFVDPTDPGNAYSVVLPNWDGTIAPFRIPITGRHSGTWVAEGAVDQGFVISFNELLVGGEVQQFIFFSWYTFDAEGNTLWLTAGATYEVGDSEVDMNLELVTNGAFLGDTAADRENVGTANLYAESCGEMTLTYDLSAIGLGMGTVTLRRIFALETAGYACRDVEARIEEL